MTDPAPQRPSHRRRNWLGWVLLVIAGVAGAAYGYRFGDQLAGPWIGVVTGAMGALFTTLVADALVSKWITPTSTPGDRR